MNTEVPRPPYRNAPILEAIVDIHVQYPQPGPTEEQYRRFASAVQADFPRNESQFAVELQLHGDSSDGPPEHSGETHFAGLRLFRPENDRVMVIRNEGFAYSHLTPYKYWDVLRGEGVRYWRAFVDEFRPTAVTRVAVRNINRLRLPAGAIDLGEYLLFTPEAPRSLGPATRIVMQMEVAQPSIGPAAVSVVTLASESPTAPDHQPMILDVDVFNTGSWEPKDPAVWEQLEMLRSKKSEIFEAVITDKTRRLFA